MLILSRLIVSFSLNKATSIANPMAASAVAIAIENIANTWPVALPLELENATRLRFAEFRSSSMHIRILIPLLCVIIPYTPMVNIIIEIKRYEYNHILCLLFCDIQGTDQCC